MPGATSMASVSAFTSSVLSDDDERPSPESMKTVVVSINKYILHLLADTESWSVLVSGSTSKLNIQGQEFFEFADHSVLSNLYWGIENIEAAIRAVKDEDKTRRLQDSERMLQFPALLDEEGTTAGFANDYLICCAYFYLAVVSRLRDDEFQVALHFLQALLVSPRTIRTEFAPELCQILFPASTVEVRSQIRTPSNDLRMHGIDSINERIRQNARRYKHWLTYYQVMLYGSKSQRQCSGINEARNDDQPNKRLFRCNLQTDHGVSSQRKALLIDTPELLDGPTACLEIEELQDYSNSSTRRETHLLKCGSTKCLHELLAESESDASSSPDSCYVDDMEEVEAEENVDDATRSNVVVCEQKLHALLSMSKTTEAMMFRPQNNRNSFTKRSRSAVNTSRFDDSDSDYINKSGKLMKVYMGESLAQMTLQQQKVRAIDQATSTALKKCSSFNESDILKTYTNKKQSMHRHRKFNDLRLHPAKDSKAEVMTELEKAISRLCFAEGLAGWEEEYAVEIMTIYEMLNNKTGVKYSMLKEVILDQLLAAISSSTEDTVVKASVSILSTIISVNKSVIEDIKKKGLRLSDLATVLKRNVHEAATLIYLIDPSPTEIKTLELLPTLVDIVCTSNSYKTKISSFLLTPPAASLKIIEVLVTAFDQETNSTHLATITSPRVLSGLLEVATINIHEECISLANILVKCMQYDGKCRKHISQSIPVAPLRRLLLSNDRRAKFAALEFFHEILCMPRSSAVSLLKKIQEEGTTNFMQSLSQCIKDYPPHYQILAASIMFQLDIVETSSSTSISVEEAIQIILKSLAFEEAPSIQKLSAYILANIGGTYNLTGEPYTVAWLVKKAGLTSLSHRNMIKNFDWSDQCLQDTGIDAWCSKVAKVIIDMGKPVFCALEKGLRSTIKRVSQDCLTTIAWIGYEIAKYLYSVRYSACEILLDGIEQFLHPGLELQERILACLSIYNYASGKGMQKLIHFSEGVRESLRRLSSATWMAEELHRVADYYLPNKSRISCVHTQVMEAKCNSSGAVTALIYYRGLLCSGYSDGSIKVWDINQHSATLVSNVKEHKKAVTCFALSEVQDSLLSGSNDKTIRVWQMIQKNLGCTEVIAANEPIRKLETYSQLTFAITDSHLMKIFDASRTIKDTCKAKKVKSMSVIQGKVYVGCIDSSIQEFNIANNREREIKAATKSWIKQSKPIRSIVTYKDWLYCAGSVVEGSKLKEWRTNYKPQMSIARDKSRSVVAIGVVEDFIYVNCSSSNNTLQIWLRGSGQKVGRISAGSKITSLLTGNDIVFCGTEKGLIKGWIPL